jgi:hypothetical protein
MTSGSQPPHSLIKSRGKVVVVEPDVVGWVEAPPFTGDLKHAKSLIPDGLHTIASVSESVCRTALGVLAIDAPPIGRPGFLGLGGA